MCSNNLTKNLGPGRRATDARIILGWEGTVMIKESDTKHLTTSAREGMLQLLRTPASIHCRAICHGAKAKYAVQTLVLIQEELAKEES